MAKNEALTDILVYELLRDANISLSYKVVMLRRYMKL